MVMVNGKEQMFTATEVAHLLNVHINTVRRWSNQGILKTYRIGPRGDRRFSPDVLEEFLIQNGDNNHNGGFGHTVIKVAPTINEKVETRQSLL